MNSRLQFRHIISLFKKNVSSWLFKNTPELQEHEYIQQHCKIWKEHKSCSVLRKTFAKPFCFTLSPSVIIISGPCFPLPPNALSSMNSWNIRRHSIKDASFSADVSSTATGRSAHNSCWLKFEIFLFQNDQRNWWHQEKNFFCFWDEFNSFH